MSKGFCLLAQNNSTTDYVKQAYALALSIHKFNKDQKVSIITNDPVPDRYKSVFDQIIPIPFIDDAECSDWKIENRWKVYHATPYDETIVMDVDMLVLSDINHWWTELAKRDLFFVSNVKTYRQEYVTSRYYRKVFDRNNLPNLYCGIYYFKKSDTAHNFFNLLEVVMNNWQLFYGKYATADYQNWCSMDVSCSIVSKLLDNSKDITHPNSYITFTHMKPHVQGWKQVPKKWSKVIGSYLTNEGDFLLGNYKQDGVLHYVEDEFLTDNLLARLEKL